MLSGEGFVKIKNSPGNTDESVRIGRRVSDRIRAVNGLGPFRGGLDVETGGRRSMDVAGAAERALFALRSREWRGSGYDIDPGLIGSTRSVPSDSR